MKKAGVGRPRHHNPSPNDLLALSGPPRAAAGELLAALALGVTPLPAEHDEPIPYGSECTSCKQSERHLNGCTKPRAFKPRGLPPASHI